jgi:ubiquinone/menaquinone biosynthesis C-methylase UbiE
MTLSSAPSRNREVRSFWEQQPCGTDAEAVGDAKPGSAEWYGRIEAARYAREPLVHSIAQFTRWHGHKVLEIGVGSGADHLQFARAGADLWGVDLTDAAVETTRQHLELHGFTPRVQRADAEHLAFEPESFDLVYSFGVIHHAASPEAVVAEIHRVLRPGGRFIGMLYARRSLLAAQYWVAKALLAGRPAQSLRTVLSRHMESPGTKAYTERELRALFHAFSSVRVRQHVTYWDVNHLPRMVRQLVPDRLGWFFEVNAVR